MHYGTGVLSAAMLGWFADGTPWTMGWIVGIGGIGSLAAAVLLVRRDVGQAEPRRSTGPATPR
jgi:DHA1 family bicyclomycin/chloramphenicol resistance-like MFS transporter